MLKQLKLKIKILKITMKTIYNYRKFNQMMIDEKIQNNIYKAIKSLKKKNSKFLSKI